jgi:signal transduction histidine kinase
MNKSETVRIFLFQAARELLLNIVKHAHAKSAQMCIRRLDMEQLRLSISDDGRGFDPNHAKRDNLGGFGLFSIRERLGADGRPHGN